MRPTFGRPTALCKYSPFAAVSSPFEIILADEEKLFPMKQNRISLEEMIRLYEEEELSLTAVGRRAGITRQGVHYQLVRPVRDVLRLGDVVRREVDLRFRSGRAETFVHHSVFVDH